MSVQVTTSQLLRAGPEFIERMEVLGREGNSFMLDGDPHLLTNDRRRLIAPETYEKLASFLLCGGDVEIVNAASGAVCPNTRQFVTDFARRLETTLRRYPDTWPTLKSYVRGPMFRRDNEGRMVRVPEGYDPISRQLILDSNMPAVLPPVAPGYPHLRTLFSGLKFVDPVYEANLLGVAVAMFCRTGMPEFPVIMLDATQKSSGKTTTLSTLLYLMNGDTDASCTYSGTEQEFEVRVGSFCGLPGPNVIPIDNIRTKKGSGYLIRSQTLASAVHSHVSKVRKLYDGLSLLFDPIFIGTMNDARVERDLADKTVSLTLTRPPSSQSHRKILPYPLDYVQAHRIDLVAEIFQIIGRLRLPPVADAALATRFYTFEQVVVGAARELGLEASFESARVRTVDAFLEELLNLMYDDMPDLVKAGGIPMAKLVNSIESHPAFRELNEVLTMTPRANSGKAAAFTEHLQNSVHGKTYRWRGQVVTLTVDNDQLCLYNSQV